MNIKDRIAMEKWVDELVTDLKDSKISHRDIADHIESRFKGNVRYEALRYYVVNLMR